MKQPFPFNPVPATPGLKMSADNPYDGSRNTSTQLDTVKMPSDKGPYWTKSTHPHAAPWTDGDTSKAHGKNKGW